MKLLRYGPKGKERPGLLDKQGNIRDISGQIDDIHPATLSSDCLAGLAALDPDTLPLVEGSPRIAAPLTGVGKILAIGKNYSEHAAEMGMEAPEEPMLFQKAVTAITGPTGPVILPPGAAKTDWEVELAVVIGTKANYILETDVANHIAGYTVLNDISERAWQKERGGQFTKGKSADTFCPLGPYLVTPDEIEDPQNLPIWLELNGEKRQNGNTKDMTHGVVKLVSYLSHFMTLMPGDIITTGTPSGVGAGAKPQRFLQVGDMVRCGIEGIGIQEWAIEAYKPV